MADSTLSNLTSLTLPSQATDLLLVGRGTARPNKVAMSDALNSAALAATTGAYGVVQLAASGGTTAGTVVQATDARLSDTRNPPDGSKGDIVVSGSGSTWTIKTNPTLSGTVSADIVRVGDGTAAAPSLSFTNDSDTGFYKVPAATDIVYFAAGGQPSLRLVGGGLLYSGGINSYLQLANTGAINLVADVTTNQNISLSASGTGAVVLNATNILFRSQTGGIQWAQFNNVGTLTLGTGTDSGNGRIQLVTHTAATGGIGFGTDVTLYRSAADILKTDDSFYIARSLNSDFIGLNVSNGNTGTTARTVLSVDNAAYAASFSMGGQSLTNNNFLRQNRAALIGPFDLNYVSTQHFWWVGGGGAGDSPTGASLVYTIGLGAKITHNPIGYSLASWLTTGAIMELNGALLTNNSTAASGTAASAVAHSVAVSTFAATNASVTTTNAATFYIAGNPVAGTNQTFTNAWGLWNVGRTKLGGFVRIDDSTASTSTSSGALVVIGGVGTLGAINAGGAITSNNGAGSGLLGMRSSSGNASYIFWSETAVADRGILGFNSGSGTLSYRSQSSSFATGAEVFAVASAGHTRIGASGSVIALSAANNVDTGLPAAWNGNYGLGVYYSAASTNTILIGDGSAGTTIFATRTASTNTARVTIDNTNGNVTIGGNLVVTGTISPSSGAGLTNVWIPASQWIPRTTNGCGVDSTQTTTNLQNFDELLFDPAAIEYAQALVRMPSNYNNGTVTARFFWSSSSSTGSVVWGLQARAFADDDALDTAFGTAQTVTDTLLATGDMHISAATSAVTSGGTPAATTPLQFQIYRDATNGSDTLGSDARLLGVEISFTSV